MANHPIQPADDPITAVVVGPHEPSTRIDHHRVAVVGTTADADDAVGLVLDHVPDVVVLEGSLGYDNVRDACRRTHAASPASRVTVLAPRDDEHAYATLVAGAVALIVTTDPVALEPRSLGRALAGIARGESLLTCRTAARLLHDVEAWSARSTDPLHPAPTLTATEREVLGRLAEGHRPADIAADHDVTARLVNIHTGYAVTKLQRYVVGAERLAVD